MAARVRIAILGLSLGLLPPGSNTTRAEDEPAPPKSASRPVDKPSSPKPASRESELEERLKKLEARYEAMERRHAEEVETLRTKYESLEKSVKDAAAAPKDDGTKPAQSPATPTPATPASEPSDDDPGTGEGAADLPVETPAKPAEKKSSGPKRVPIVGKFGRGFEWETEDEEFQLQFHLLSDIDYRLYTQPNQDPVHSGFSFPRERLYFSGRMTKSIEYYFTINRAFGNLDLFDSFINFRAGDRFQVKVGRFKTPYAYEFYAYSGQYLITPERSLFVSNFAPNREMGMMAWGQLFDKRLDYAAGIFNGNRFSFQDTNEPKDVIAYVNARPFEKAGERWAALRHLNFGGSLAYGNEFNNPPQPATLRTSIGASNSGDAPNIAPAFLAYRSGVLQSGMRSLWDLHIAYFYRRFTIMGEWNAGYDTFRRSLKTGRTVVPLDGYYVVASYFLTGETHERRGDVRPIRPFRIAKEGAGPGALEVFSRFSRLGMGNSVFAGGLADRSSWTNRLYSIDVGMNWYLNEYVKIVGAWEHAEFATPVLYRPDARHINSDLFWLRFQLYF